MIIDGTKLRELRIQKGISQEKLGLLSNLNKRTIQRAEKGDAVSLETIAFIADALETEPRALRGRQLELFNENAQTPNTQQGEVILVPVSRGTRLVNTLRSAFCAKFEYEAEPTENTVELLEEVALILNSSWTNPWEEPDFSFEDGTGDAQRIRLQARANRIIEGLSNKGITIFMGTYVSWSQIPSFDQDEGMMSVFIRQPIEKITNALVVVSDERAKHLSRMPDDHEANTAPEPARDLSAGLDDEIPF